MVRALDLTSPAGSPPTKILIVDDHAVLRMGLAALFGTVPHFAVVGEAATAAAALVEARRCRPDVVMMDVRLPDGSGVEACREIRAERPETRVIMFTSFADEDSVIEAVMEEVATRLKDGRIIIGDAPQTDSSFEDIRSRLGLDAIAERTAARWPGISVDVVDLRREWWIQRGGVTVERVTLPGDPSGGTVVDLASDSRFACTSG